jgi:hypothetical protein
MENKLEYFLAKSGPSNPPLIRLTMKGFVYKNCDEHHTTVDCLEIIQIPPDFSDTAMPT